MASAAIALLSFTIHPAMTWAAGDTGKLIAACASGSTNLDVPNSADGCQDTVAPDDSVFLQHVLRERHNAPSNFFSSGLLPWADVEEVAATGGAALLAAGEANSTTPDPTGLTLNAVGDMAAFLSALASNSISCLLCICIFTALRAWYPMMYSNNVLTGEAPSAPPETLFSWISASLGLTIDESIEKVGMDQAMVLEFLHLAMKVSATIGIPMLCICAPLNVALGGHAAGQDHLSYLGFGNVRNGSPLYWMYAVVVWGVVFVVQGSIYRAQRTFLHRRFTWLREMSPLQANTILVEGIPMEYRSDKKLHDFFEEVLPGDGNVLRAYVVKDTSALLPKFGALMDARCQLKEVEAIWTKAGRDEAQRPQMRSNSVFYHPTADSMEHLTQTVASLEKEVAAERERIEAEAAGTVGAMNLSKGFVTFHERVEAELALRLTGVSEDAEQWRISRPPAPSDIQWEDLTQDTTAETSQELIGYLLLVALFFAYMPGVIFITNLAKLLDMGPLQPLWQGLAPTIGLQFMVAFLPTFLIWIFKIFFSLKAAQWAQQKLQVWYFWFQVVFVVLAAAVGQNMTGVTRQVIEDPLGIPNILARTLPYATHFFLNFLVLQWLAHCMALLRYFPLGKYLVLKRIYADEEARAMSEPEDQDYYGMGSRSARWTTALVIGIVYGTLAPLINAVVFINFAVCRLVYGYLLPFAETKKTDLGGVFWVSQLRHLFVGNIIYCMLMTGVLYNRAGAVGPAMIAAPSIVYVVWSMRRFETAFSWENLPFQELQQASVTEVEKRPNCGQYIQPELAGGALALALAEPQGKQPSAKSKT